MSEETSKEKNTVKTQAPAKRKNKQDKKSPNMLYSLGDIFRNTPGFEKLRKNRNSKVNYVRQKDNQ